MLTIEQLKHFYLFSDIPQADLPELTRCGEIVDFEAGDTIFEEGANAGASGTGLKNLLKAGLRPSMSISCNRSLPW